MEVIIGGIVINAKGAGDGFANVMSEKAFIAPKKVAIAVRVGNCFIFPPCDCQCMRTGKMRHDGFLIFGRCGAQKMDGVINVLHEGGGEFFGHGVPVAIKKHPECHRLHQNHGCHHHEQQSVLQAFGKPFSDITGHDGRLSR